MIEDQGQCKRRSLIMDGYQQQVQIPETQENRASKFSLDGFSPSLLEEVKKRAEINGTLPLVAPLEPHIPVKGFQFKSPTAQRFIWKNEDPEIQDKINAFADNLGLAFDNFSQGNYPVAQQNIHYAGAIREELPQTEQKWADMNYQTLEEQLNKANPQGLSLMKGQDLSGQIQSPAQEQEAQAQNTASQPVVAPAPNAAPQKPANAVNAPVNAMVPANIQQDPKWKLILSKLPVIKYLVNSLPNHPSIYDSILHRVIGDNWQKYKGFVTFALIAGGATATYFGVVRPLLNNGKEETLPKPRRRNNPKKKRRKRKNFATRKKTGESATKPSSEPKAESTKPRKRRARKPKNRLDLGDFSTPENNGDIS